MAARRPVRCLVRDPRRLGPERDGVEPALGDLARPSSFASAVRGATTVIHLAAAIRDQPGAPIEELNGRATVDLLRAAERAGVERFAFFSAIGASEASRSRFFRAKALAERAVQASELQSLVFAPSIVYAPGDPWLGLLERLSRLPVMPVSGSGQAAFQPILADDVAACVVRALEQATGEGEAARPGAARDRRFELAGPEVLTYDDFVRVALRAWGRRRRLLHVPLPLVRTGLRALERLAGPRAFATWDEAELMEIPMTTPRGTADAESLAVAPARLEEVLARVALTLRGRAA